MEARVCCDTIESEFELIRTLGFLCNCARGLVYVTKNYTNFDKLKSNLRYYGTQKRDTTVSTPIRFEIIKLTFHDKN